MKIFCALLAFLVLTLSVQPVCASISASENCCSEKSCNEDPSSSADEDEKECDACNPFQLCGCCAYTVVPSFQPLFVAQTESVFAELSWGTFNCPFIEEPVLGFWQPPKLA